MRIRHKLILGFLAVVLLTCLSGYLAVSESQKALHDSIGEKSKSFVEKLTTEIDRTIYNRIEYFYVYSKDLELVETVSKSNQEFEKLSDIQSYIDKKDSEWVSLSKDKTNPLIEKLMDNELSKELRKKVKFYEERYGYKVLGKIFATNKYGANTALTDKTTDYRQDDEQWWQEAKEKGIYVSDVEFDKSANIYSVNIATKLDDENGNFTGIIKIVQNIEEVINLIKEAKALSKYKTTEFKLLTKDGKLIYSTGQFRTLENVSDLLFSCFIEKKSGNHATDMCFVYKDKLYAHAHSKGHKNFEGLGWILLVEYEAKEVFAPVIQLKKQILSDLLVVVILALTISLYVSISISKPIKKLRTVAAEIGKGNLDAQIDLKLNDETGELADSFRKMTKDLKTTTTSLEHLNHEIAERKRIEEDLRSSEERFRVLFEYAPDGYYLYDLEGKFIDSNKVVERITGYKKEDLIGKNFLKLNLLSPNQIPKAEVLLAENGRGLPTGPDEFILKRKDGKEVDVEIRSYPVKIKDEKVILSIARDITERKEVERKHAKLAEEIENTNKELNDFAHIVSHDLKAPLRGIRTLVKWITESYADKLDEDGKKQLDMLSNQTHKMHNLIDGILQYSRIGHAKETLIQTDLNKLVADVIDMVAAPENIEISIENQLPVIECEQTRIMQVFENLFSNAIKYMDKAQGQIRVGCAEEDGFWKFRVADNGPGIEEKDFERIFQIFQTVSAKDEFESTGVGLSLVKKIVEMYGGKTWVESEVGNGSTFFFTISKLQIKNADDTTMQTEVALSQSHTV